jgi:predicted acyltransferase (DUF342 family)
MANTVSILSYANTFGDWVVNTNKIAGEINALGKGTYTKDTGILVLNGPGTGLQVSNNALFTSNVNITGAGQALQVTNDAIISGNLTVLGNTSITLNEIVFQDFSSNTLHSNAAFLGTANVINDLGVSGNIYANYVTANGLISLSDIASNTATLNTINVVYGANVGSDLGVTGNVYANKIVALSSITANSVTINTSNTISNANVGGNLEVTGSTYITGDITVTGNANIKLSDSSSANILATALAFSIALG